MILANVREGLGREDAQLAIRLIGRDSGEALERAEETLRACGMDGLLDDERLFHALLEARQGAHASYALFAYVIVRHELRRAGEENRALADYVASVLMHFGMRDRATRVADSDDELYHTLADLVGATEGPDARRNFLVRAHLGNYALWLSGLFPDLIESRRWRHRGGGGPDLDYFDALGSRGFQLAADHRLANEHGLAGLYAIAAERFVTLRLALNAVSDRLLFPNAHSPERLMRHVRDEARWRRPN